MEAQKTTINQDRTPLPEVPDEFAARLIFDALNDKYAFTRGYRGTEIQAHPLGSIWNRVEAKQEANSKSAGFSERFTEYCSATLGITPNRYLIELMRTSVRERTPPKGQPLAKGAFYAPLPDQSAIFPGGRSIALDHVCLYLEAHARLSSGWFPNGADELLAQSRSWYSSKMGYGPLNPSSKEFPERAPLHDQMIYLRNHLDRVIKEIEDGEERAAQYGKKHAPENYRNASREKLLATTFVVWYHFAELSKSKLTLQKAFDVAQQAVYGESKKPQKVASVIRDLKSKKPADNQAKLRKDFWLRVLDEEQRNRVSKVRNPEQGISQRRRDLRMDSPR